MMKLTAVPLVLMAASMMCATMAAAEELPPQRTLEELKAEAQARADRNAYPLIGLQVPIADIDLLLHSGETPKDAWINPAGGHMGREAKGWSDPVIFKRVTMPWLLRALEAKTE